MPKAHLDVETTHRKHMPKTAKTPQQRHGPRGGHEVVPNLFISGEALAMSEERLRQLGISAIVACGCKSHFPAKFLYHEVHVQDNANAKISSFALALSTALAIIVAKSSAWETDANWSPLPGMTIGLPL